MDRRRIRQHPGTALRAAARSSTAVGGRRLLPVALLCGLAAGALGAAVPVPVGPDQPVTSLRGAIDVLEDPEGRLSFAEVSSPPIAARFRAHPSDREPSFGNTSSAYWLRFGLENRHPQPVELLLRIGFPLLDRVELHAPGTAPLVVGDSLPFSERPLQVRQFVIPLELPAAANRTYHLRVTTAGLLFVPLEIGSAGRMFERAHGQQLLTGLFYGILVGALLYNLFLWASVRDSVHLYLVGHIASIGVLDASLDGLAFRLWPNATGWQQWASHTSVLTFTLFTLLFVRSLVDSRRTAPSLDRLLKLTFLLQLAAAGLGVLGGPHLFLATAMAGLFLISLLLAAIVILRAHQGHAGARIYSVAWVVFLLVLSLGALAGLGWLPGFLDLMQVARVAGAIEVLLAAIAVAANLRQARQALAASEEKFSRAFRSSPDALTLSTVSDGRFIEVNDAFERISGFRRADVIGRTSLELGMWPAAIRARFLERFERDGSVSQMEAIITGKDGRRIAVQISGELIELDRQPVLLATTRDVTERQVAAEQRELLIRELEAKNTELERFTYTASHDLRSPLVTILGFLGVLEKDIDKGDTRGVRRAVGRIREAALHMRQLLDELLQLSRVGVVVQRTQRVPLGTVVEEAVALLQEAVAERRVDLRIAPDLPLVRGDHKRLVQVFQNLLDNSLRFLGDQPRPVVEIGWRRDGERTVCFVRDNGIGIEPRHHEAVFELFRRLQPGVAGTGVGLALVRRIVEGHGGEIWVESAGAGQGSTFCFTLDARRPRRSRRPGSAAAAGGR